MSSNLHKGTNQIVLDECADYDLNHGCIRTICSEEKKEKYKCCIMCSDISCKRYKKCGYFEKIVITCHEIAQRAKEYNLHKHKEK